METEQITRKRRNLVIDDDEDDDVQPAAPAPPPPAKQQEKKEQVVEKAEHHAPEPTKHVKDANGNSKSAQNPQQVKNTADLNKKVQEKTVRKEQERTQVVQQKVEVESDGHASDKDLFLPDDSNSEDIQEIRNKYGWKAKFVPPPPASKPKPSSSSTSSATKSTSSRTREEPVKKGKDTLVYDVLKRWWYALPEWPPANYDYTPALEARKLRVVNKQKFKILPDLDERGFAKVYEILGYNGLFKDINNKLYDLRPEDGKPSYTSIAKKSEGELLGLLKICYQKQIEELEKSKVIDENLLITLKRSYEKVKLRVKD